MTQFIDLFKWVCENYGFQAGIIAYFLVRDAVRDRKQEKIINGLQDEMRNILIPIVRENATVISESNAVLWQVRSALKECQDALKAMDDL